MTIAPPIARLEQGIYVVRDDLVLGGTKRRYIDDAVLASYDEFVYASPVYGGAQIALAYACQAVGKTATIFCAKRNELHQNTLRTQAAGATIHQVPYGYLTNVQSKARAYCAQTGAYLVPFGFDTPEANIAIANAARQVVSEHGVFDECWCAAGSGVLTRGLQAGGIAMKYFAVAVGGETNAGVAAVIKHPLAFEKKSRTHPPFPSCENYDAKVWEYVRLRTGKILFWNVMG